MRNGYLAQLPLGQRPNIVRCGLVEHGRHGIERYQSTAYWCLHLYFYCVELEINRRRHPVVPGTVTLVPPGTKMVYHYTPRLHRHFFVHFTMGDHSPRATVPVIQHLPEGRDEMFDRLENIARRLPRNRIHAEILLWGLLWDVAEAGASTRKRIDHPLVEQVDRLLDGDMVLKLSAQKISRQMGFSVAHINRVVKARHGFTVMQLLRKRKWRHAYRLLLHSALPVKQIASECGVDDLQKFNKCMRAEYGQSPRSLREEHRKKSGEKTWTLEQG
jgi:AraC family transcriptional regulator